MALAHVEKDKTVAAYARSDLFERRRKLMEAWANFVADHGSYRVTTPITVVGSNISLSVFSVLSYTVLSEWRVLGLDVNGAMDYFSNQILLPLGGLLIAVFAGWFISGESTRAELRLDSSASFQLWRFLIRGPVPTAVAIIFVIGVS